MCSHGPLCSTKGYIYFLDEDDDFFDDYIEPQDYLPKKLKLQEDGCTKGEKEKEPNGENGAVTSQTFLSQVEGVTGNDSSDNITSNAAEAGSETNLLHEPIPSGATDKSEGQNVICHRVEFDQEKKYQDTPNSRKVIFYKYCYQVKCWLQNY